MLQAVANFDGQNNFFSRIDPTGLCNQALTEKARKLQRCFDRIHSRLVESTEENATSDLDIIDNSPHGVSLVSLIPSAFDFGALKV